jgi:hypothetical protein
VSDELPGELRVWTPERRALDELICNRNPELASIYHCGIDLLDSTRVVGTERARIALICHAMRELVIGVPALLSDEIVKRSGTTSSSLVQRLASLTQDLPALDLSGDLSYVAVPRDIATHLASLIEVAQLESARSHANDALLVTRSSNQKSPAVKQWRDAREYFVEWAHWDRKSPAEAEQRVLPTDAEILERVVVAEDLIRVRLNGFFDSRHEIDDFLAEINAPLRPEEIE